MDKNRLWILGAGLVVVVILVLGWVVGVNPQLEARSTAHTQQQGVDAQNQQLSAKLEELRGADSRKDEYVGRRDMLRSALPSELDYSGFLSELNSIASSRHVRITGITGNDPVPYAPQGPASPSPASSDNDKAGAGEAEQADSSSPAPAAPAAPAADQATPPAPYTSPLVTQANFLPVPVQVTVEGSYDNVLSFVGEAQRGSRLFLVNQLQTSKKDDESTSVTGTISGFIYVLQKK